MSRSVLGATIVAALSGLAATQAAAADLPGYLPHHRHHHVVARHWPPHIVYGRADLAPRPPVYNHEDNGAYDGADLPRRHGRVMAYGQGPSWLDGYGTRQVVVPGYGATDVYGGSAQVWPHAIPPAGGLAVYIPGAYGPGPRIVSIPDNF